MAFSVPKRKKNWWCGEGEEGSTRWPKATSPPQELDVGAHRALYLLVNNVEDIKR